jgi:hypothetical protein
MCFIHNAGVSYEAASAAELAARVGYVPSLRLTLLCHITAK